MSRNIAIGVVIGGAVSSTLGAAVGRTKQSITDLQKGLNDTSGMKNLIGETQRLQRELAEADRVGRRVGLDAVRTLRGELSGLEKDWQANTARVAELARAHAKAKQAAAGGAANVEALERERQAAGDAAQQVKAHHEAKRAAWREAKANADVPREQVQALKAEAQAAESAAKEAKALSAAKKGQHDLARAAAAEEARLAGELDKARREAGRAKDAFEGKRKALHDTRSELRATVPVVGEAVRSTVQLGDAARSAAKGQQQLAGGNLRERLAANISKLKEAGVEVGNLDRALKKLQQTEKGVQWQQRGAANMQAGAELGQTAGAVTIGAAAVPTMISGDYQAEIRDIAIKSGIAMTVTEGELSAKVSGAADAARMDRHALAVAVNGLVTQGMDWQKAAGHGGLLAELIKGQKMAPEDAAKLIYSFGQNGVSDKDMRKTMGEMAVAGDLGAFESNMMAKYLPELMATTGALGFQGPEAARYLAASLQAQVKLTGDPDSAANNLKNLLSKVTAPEVNKIFEKAGIDLQASMRAYMKAGQNPIEAFVALTERLAAGESGDKQKQLAALKDKIRNAGNKGDETAALDAYMKMAGLGDVIQDMQARAAALAQIKYGKQIAADLKKIETTDGGKKLAADKVARDDTSNAGWDAVRASFNAAMISIGDAIRPVTDEAARLTESLLRSSGELAAANPNLALGAVAAGVLVIGAAAAKVAAGAAQWGAGKVLSGLGSKGAGSGVAAAADAARDVLDGKGDGIGGMGVQKVFVVNMPAGGMAGGADLPDGKPGQSGKGKPGRLGRAVGAVKNAAGSAVQLGRAAMAAPTLGAVAGSGAAGVATAGAMVVGAGAAGYAAGAAINAGVTAALTATNGGRERTLGTWFYDKMHGDRDARLLAPVPLPPRPAAVPPKPEQKPVAKPAPKPVPVTQQFTFSPTVQVKVMGDAKRPEEIAAQITPHMKRLFDQWIAGLKPKTAGGMYDPVGA